MLCTNRSSPCVFGVSDFISSLSSNDVCPPHCAVEWYSQYSPRNPAEGQSVDCQEAAEKDPLGFLTQLMHRAERSQRGWKTLDWKVQVCSICYRPSHFINAGKRQTEAQLGKRCPLDRLRARIALLLTGPSVHRNGCCNDLSTFNFRSIHCDSLVWHRDPCQLSGSDVFAVPWILHMLTVDPREHPSY